MIGKCQLNISMFVEMFGILLRLLLPPVAFAFIAISLCDFVSLAFVLLQSRNKKKSKLRDNKILLFA